MQNLLKLAIESEIPLIWLRTDDPIHIEEVLTHIAGKEGSVLGIKVAETIVNAEELKSKLKGYKQKVFYTSDQCKSLVSLWRIAIEIEKTIIFVNTEKSGLLLDTGVLLPPMELVKEYLKEMEVGDPESIEALLPTFGGMTIKDVIEVCKMTATRDQSVTPRGVNETRRGYNKLQGITQVDTAQDFYICPQVLEDYLSSNVKFFKEAKHPSLMPRGLLLDGPPGTGKTAASKAIAERFGVPLYRLDLGAMMGKYVGESEGNLNAALAQVDEVSPAVIIFDEVEKVFQGQSDSGVTSRLLSQLLWWLQEHKTPVFTVMTTNDVGKIPVELWRPGRIDMKMQFLGIAGKADGYTFTKGAFDSMLAHMGFGTGKPADYAKLKKAVDTEYSNGKNEVPQVKLTLLANALVKEVLTADAKE